MFAVAVKAIFFRTIEKDHHTLIIFRDSWLVFSTFFHSGISFRAAMEHDIGFGGFMYSGDGLGGVEWTRGDALTCAPRVHDNDVNPSTFSTHLLVPSSFVLSCVNTQHSYKPRFFFIPLPAFSC